MLFSAREKLAQDLSELEKQIEDVKKLRSSADNQGITSALPVVSLVIVSYM